MEDRTRTIPGKYAILTMLLLGVAAAGYTQFYYSRMQRRPIELWGGYNAQLMMNAPLVNAMRLAPTDDKAGAAHLERLMIGGEHLSVLAEKNVTNQPGFSHVRQSLVNDNSFDWAGPDNNCKPEWKYALEFSNGEHTALLLIAPDCGLARLSDTGATGVLRPVMPGIEHFLRDQFPEKK